MLANNTYPAGLRVDEFARATGVGRTTLYTMAPALRPASVLVGRSRIIVEHPATWLERLRRLQEDGAALYVVRDRRADGEPREVGRFRDPAEARAAAAALRAAGAQLVDVDVVPAIDPLAVEPR